MNSESGQRLSVEELKRLNQPPAPSVPATPPDAPTRQDWDDLLAALTALYRLESTNSSRLERLEASVGPQEALLRALGRQVPTGGAAPHPGPTGGAGGGCGPNERGAETGWEKERAFYFTAQSGDGALRTDLAGPDFAGNYGGDGGLADNLVRLGRALERGADADPVKDGTTMHQYSDRKTLRKEMRKKIAMGHKEDDHEEEQRWEQSM